MKRLTALTLVLGLALPAFAAEPNEDPVVAVEAAGEEGAPAEPVERPEPRAAVEGPVVPATAEALDQPLARPDVLPVSLMEQDASLPPLEIPAVQTPALQPLVESLPSAADTDGAPASDEQRRPRFRARMTPSGICSMLEEAAASSGLPAEFFARVIWQESAFNAHAVSPAGAQGVAQFMPATADERGLADPFDPAPALRHSASFLRDLRDMFGNLGLAAASYNAGPGRVKNWLDGRAGLPLETRNYVLSITGRPAEDWARARDLSWSPRVADGSEFRAACDKRSAVLTAARRRELLPTPPAMIARAAGTPGPIAKSAVSRPATPWAVELASNYKRQTEAQRIAAEIRRRHESLLRRSEPMVIEARMAQPKAPQLYRIRIGADTRDTADKLCTGLQAAGSPCVVTETLPERREVSEVKIASKEEGTKTASKREAKLAKSEISETKSAQKRETSDTKVASKRDGAETKIAARAASEAKAAAKRGAPETKLASKLAGSKTKTGPKRDRALEEGPKLAEARGRPIAPTPLRRPTRAASAPAKADPSTGENATSAKVKIAKARSPEPSKRSASSARS